MPNYSLTVNSLFQPFSYQELAAPLDRQEAYQEKLIDEYDKLSSQADILEAMGTNDRDKASGAYSRYKAYSDSLRNEADNLLQFGLNTESRRRLSDIRRRYNTEVVPIQNAWNKREEESKMQLAASIQNPSLMFTRDAVNTSLDDYIRNPQGGFGVINGANITAQMSTMAKNLSEQVRRRDRTGIDDYTYNYIEHYGLDANIIRNWQDSPTLKRMFEQVMQSNGVTPEALQGSLNAQNIIDKSTGYAEMGMWSAMGKDVSHIQENYGARLEAQATKEIDVARRKAELAAAGSNPLGDLREEGAGIETADGYVTNAREVIDDLKAGQNSWKASYFGRVSGSVNPLKIYNEYQNELKKHVKKGTFTQYSPSAGIVVNTTGNVADEDAAKRAVLNKYKKYGVTDIISPEQYNVLKASGYDENSSFRNVWHNDVMNNVNRLALAHTRYSTTMANYDKPDEWIRGSLMRWDNEGTLNKARIFELEKNNKLGDAISDISDLDLYSPDNTKGNKINDIQYDPNHKGMLMISLSKGQRFLATPDVIDKQLTKEIEYWESRNADPRVITARIRQYLNKYNPVRSNTDKDA